MTKAKGNEFASCYHRLVDDLYSGRITKAAYDMMYISLNAVYEGMLCNEMDFISNAVNPSNSTG